MTITEFILARVAQDERDALDYWDHDGDGPGTWLGWVKADCEAKRRIVELTMSWRDHADRFATGSDAVSAVLEAQALTAETVLGVLARVWVDHPDYREEWR